MVFFQCSKCDKEKGECKCEKPEFLSYLDKNDHKQIQKEAKTRQELEKNASYIVKEKFTLFSPNFYSACDVVRNWSLS